MLFYLMDGGEMSDFRGRMNHSQNTWAAPFLGLRPADTIVPTQRTQRAFAMYECAYFYSHVFVTHAARLPSYCP
jgi:hypothetical protein